uniref:Uncharacterized protein n=1 Tax=Solanum tuberosum TaxID=4113 RepID=M1AGJ0_SOLTU
METTLPNTPRFPFKVKLLNVRGITLFPRIILNGSCTCFLSHYCTLKCIPHRSYMVFGCNNVRKTRHLS